jgi:hypothetical protein
MDLIPDQSNLIRYCLFGYFQEKNTFGAYYLMVLCGYIDYYRLDGKIK